MDVSNSSDQNTGYRVVGGGQPPMTTKDIALTESGSIRPPRILKHGHLFPHEYETLELEEEASWVEFDLEGEPKPVRVKVPKGDSKHLLVALVPNGKGTPKAFVCRRKAKGKSPGSGAEQGGSATA